MEKFHYIFLFMMIFWYYDFKKLNISNIVIIHYIDWKRYMLYFENALRKTTLQY